MRKLKNIVVVPGTMHDPVIEVVSSSNPNKTYRVDTVNGRCSCPAWRFSRNGARTCKHLVALGMESYQGGRDTLIELPKKGA